jgi:predicted nucleic acid-binding protein
VILDSDVLIDLLRDLPEPHLWLYKQGAFPHVSGMAVLEALYGARDSASLRNVETYLKPFPILWPTDADLQTAGKLARYHLSDGIELIDSVTATLAVRHNQPLATFNVKHFRAIPGLITVQPYSRA